MDITPSVAILPRSVFIAWTPFQRRQLSMAPLLGFEPVFMPLGQGPRPLRPLQYLHHALATLDFLRGRRPETIWVQLPQVPLLSAALWHRRWVDPGVRIIADCHNRILNPPWNRWPGLKAQMNACDAVVVHNRTVLPKVEALGIRPELLRILEDPPALLRRVARSAAPHPKPWVLFLASFNPDEPIQELFAAARLAPDIHFVLAGEAGRANGRHVLADPPPNVVLPGYLSGDALDAAILEADAVLALTKLEDAQLSSAAEAIGAGRPMVLSDTPVTREMYYQGGVFVDTYDPASIVRGCRVAIAEAGRLRAESQALREERYRRWWTQAAAIGDVLDLGRSPPEAAPAVESGTGLAA